MQRPRKLSAWKGLEKDSTRVAFEFADGTNLGSHPAHMQALVMTMPNANHHTEERTFRDGSNQHTMSSIYGARSS